MPFHRNRTSKLCRRNLFSRARQEPQQRPEDEISTSPHLPGASEPTVDLTNLMGLPHVMVSLIAPLPAK